MQDRKTLRHQVEETLILYSARDVKHEIPEEASSNARLFHTFTHSHKNVCLS